MAPTWSGSTEWDNAQSHTGIHHSQPTGTDWSAADTLEKGYPSDWTNSTIPAPDHYWPLDEDSGTTANDVVGSADGTLSGGSVGTSAILGTTGYSFSFAGEVNFGTLSNFDGTTAFTVAGWFNHSSTTFTNDAAMFSFSQASDGSDCAFSVGMEDADGTIKARGNTDSDAAAGSTTSLDDDNWHMVAVTHDGTGDGSGVTIYLDGSDDTGSRDSGIAVSLDNTVESYLAWQEESENRRWEGGLSDWAVWSQELSASHISDLWQAVI